MGGNVVFTEAYVPSLGTEILNVASSSVGIVAVIARLAVACGSGLVNSLDTPGAAACCNGIPRLD